MSEDTKHSSQPPGEVPLAATETEPPPLPPTHYSEGAISAPRVFWPATVLLVVFVGFALIAPGTLDEALGTVMDTVVGDLGWFFVLSVTAMVFFSFWIGFSQMGNIVLGDPDEDPEFSLPSWFAMLFAAGMGIGLVFWGVAEPLNHFASPPPGTGDSAAARAREAMDTTFLHWGLHAWAIYVVVGLAMAYAVHRKKRPISIRWALEPIFGDRVKGWVGDVIDVLAIVGTLFGVATSLGLGVSQVGAGLGHLGVAEVNDEGSVSTTLLVLLIVGITAIATISVVTGVDKGIQFLSNINMVVAGLLMVTVLLLGPTFFLLSDFVQQLGSYIQNFFRLSFRTFAFSGEDGQGWLSRWTTFYWGWWISWSPFVGVFIARISRGRTVREFVFGVLLAPTLVGLLWFSIFGGSGIYREIFGDGGLIDSEGAVSTDLALFQMLDGLPLSTLLSVVAIGLVIVFFVTSSDSGSFVVDMIASGGDPNPPTWSRILWAVLEGSIAAALIIVGGAGGSGLSALQTMSILVAVPFVFVMIGMAVATGKALMRENELLVHGRRRQFRKSLVQEVRSEVHDFEEEVNELRSEVRDVLHRDRERRRDR
ncbi:BCCT family transporter [Marihabitans asiaticum]|uniref:Choline/glycine/proline betaine transport protein n=1 Tax=Marihabitans asiaticum TaxID=415218 RepID=A0A560WAB4_9MICO|nr:BCCT family transporter [Marihabitans asiaticum]TWD14573.1 choline/glycine/proline betaine transport protein [Marihabitans asiaticum]